MSEINVASRLCFERDITISIIKAATEPGYYLHRLLSISVRSAALFRASAVSVWLFIGAVRRWLLGRISGSRRWN
jgi:hypothetical protein